MTREEAIKILSARDNRGLPITWQDGFVEAYDMATRSLEAWDEVMKDVQDWQDDFNTHVKLLKLTDAEKEGTMMYGEDVVNILGNHMVELKGVEE